MFNKDKYSRLATEIVMSALYEFANPTNLFAELTIEDINKRIEQMVFNYRNDPMTHTRINSIVSCLLKTIDECFDE